MYKNIQTAHRVSKMGKIWLAI